MWTYAQKAKILKTILYQSIIWFVSIMCSLASGVGWVFLVMTLAGHYYALRHPVPMGEDDLGLGLMVVLWGGMALLPAIPLMFWLSCRIYRFITTVLSNTECCTK